MTEKNLQDWGPVHISDYGLQWSIPSHVWSGEKYGEDMLKVWYDHADNDWHACTEMDQCVKRDLDSEEVEAIRQEFGLDRYVEINFPSASFRF